MRHRSTPSVAGPTAEPRRRRRLLMASIAIAALVGGATGVNALSSRNSRQFAQGTGGVGGAVEVGDFFGAGLGVGDFDDDGNADLIAGAPNEDLKKKNNAGVVHVLYGSNSGVSTTGDAILHSGSANVAGKSEKNDLFGSSIAVGDFNDDGYADAVVGVPGEDVGGRTDAGAVVVLYGSGRGLRGSGSAEFTAASAGMAGRAEAHAAFGETLAVGDFDGNGIDDLAIGSPGAGGAGNDSAGAVTIMFGRGRGLSTRNSQLIHLGTPGVPGDRMAGDEFGASLAAGDFDGNGRDDLAIGSPGRTANGRAAAGAVLVFAGSKSGIRPGSASTFAQGAGGMVGTAEMDDRFGASLAAGDFDGNGRDDLAIGSPGEAAKRKTASGVVHVLRGTKSGLTTSGVEALSQATKGIKSKPQAGDEFGAALVAADFNDNGRDDLAIGVPGERLRGDPGAGVVHVVFGTKNGLRGNTQQWYRPGKGGVPGERTANAGFGRTLAAGDIDGDDRADLVTGAPGASVDGDAAAGAMTVLFG